ncbi:hypothetical protein H8356DRAFT_1422247 [Neocallimastix lanati (nom. inval.)]|nr:hypothetical protein H8356DRAFT_1422247 [Neocallimastix sp. JGI-2020a]
MDKVIVKDDFSFITLDKLSTSRYAILLTETSEKIEHVTQWSCVDLSRLVGSEQYGVTQTISNGYQCELEVNTKNLIPSVFLFQFIKADVIKKRLYK